ncbi:hypothetical protein [Subtercola sp. YIM 133946]|uniref:hypothetical protein n=1 Tax=Subtercola sp. YIM 133946 TaxID=3118909 RepID=UPI002F934DB7
MTTRVDVLLRVLLAGMVRDESIFDGQRHADRYTNTAIGALGVGAVLAVGGFVSFVVGQASSSSAEVI